MLAQVIVIILDMFHSLLDIVLFAIFTQAMKNYPDESHQLIIFTYACEKEAGTFTARLLVFSSPHSDFEENLEIRAVIFCLVAVIDSVQIHSRVFFCYFGQIVIHQGYN